MADRDREKTREQLIDELLGLRRELLMLKGSSGVLSEAGSSRRVAQGSPTSPVEGSSGVAFDAEDTELPILDEPLSQEVTARILDFAKQARHGAGIGTASGRNLTESGSFDLRWMRLSAFGKLLEAVPLPILLMDTFWRIQLANSGFYAMLDDPCQVVGEYFPSFLASDSRVNPVEGLLEQVIRYRKPAATEEFLVLGGKEVWGRLTFRSIRFGKERSVLVVVEDLSAERRELLLNEKYRVLVHHFPIGIAEFSLPTPVSGNMPIEGILPLILDATVTNGNIEFARMHGLNKVADLKGVRLGDVFPYEGKARDLYLTWVRNGFAAASVETVQQRDDGGLGYFEHTLRGIVTEGTLAMFWGMQQDVTERKRVEQELLNKIRIIDELYEHILQSGTSRIIADHTAAVAHELKQPLAIIGGFARRMAKAIASEGAAAVSRQSDCLTMMVKEVERLERILGGLIDFTRRETVDLQLVNPNEIIDYVLRINEWRLKEKSLRTETDLGKEISEIPLDATRFQHVVRNLLANAIEASPQHGVIKVETGVSFPSSKAIKSGQLKSEAYFEMKVHNVGGPIPTEDLQRIFSPFFTTKEGGTGIGLNLARKIVEEHNGSISAMSDADGTVFTVWIPLGV